MTEVRCPTCGVLVYRANAGEEVVVTYCSMRCAAEWKAAKKKAVSR